jgi:hypothetical protein
MPTVPGVPATTRANRPATGLALQSDARSYTEQGQFVGGKTFFQNAGQWIDSRVQEAPKANRVRIQFGSPEYFELIKGRPEAVSWLALGKNLQFVAAGTIYEIYE